MSKWMSVDLGPRMAKEFNETTRAFSAEASSHTELWGIVGGEEHSSSFMTIGGGWRADASALWAEIGEQYLWQVSQANRKEVMAAIMEGVRKLREARPVIDKRRTQEQEAERIAASNAAAREREEKAREKAAFESTQAATSPAVAVKGSTGATARLNPSKDGVEIVFAAKPQASVLESLKANGWRWSKFSKCWYKTDTTTARHFAEGIAGLEFGTLAAKETGYGHAPDVDRLYEDACQQATGA